MDVSFALATKLKVNFLAIPISEQIGVNKNVDSCQGSETLHHIFFRGRGGNEKLLINFHLKLWLLSPFFLLFL